MPAARNNQKTQRENSREDRPDQLGSVSEPSKQSKSSPSSVAAGGRFKVWIFRLLAILIPLVAIELGARAYFFLFVVDHTPDEYQRDDVVPYLFPANNTFLCANTPTTTNNLRIRGDEDIDPTQEFAGTRILCLGDSVTFGYCASSNQTAYPARLESLLRSQGHRVQVLNGGMPRFRMQHVAAFYQRHFVRTPIDVVIVLGGWNNANDQILIAEQNHLIGFLNQYWYTFRLIKHTGWLPKWGGRSRRSAQLSQDGLVKYGEALDQIKQMVRRSDAQVLFCTLPHFFGNLTEEDAVDRSTEFAPAGTPDQIANAISLMNDELRARSSAELPAIELGDVNTYDLFGDAIHPNDLGCEIIANRIADYLVKQKLVQENP